MFFDMTWFLEVDHLWCHFKEFGFTFLSSSCGLWCLVFPSFTLHPSLSVATVSGCSADCMLHQNGFFSSSEIAGWLTWVARSDWLTWGDDFPPVAPYCWLVTISKWYVSKGCLFAVCMFAFVVTEALFGFNMLMLSFTLMTFLSAFWVSVNYGIMES